MRHSYPDMYVYLCFPKNYSVHHTTKKLNANRLMYLQNKEMVILYDCGIKKVHGTQMTMKENKSALNQLSKNV